MNVLWGLGGMAFIIAIAVLFSVDRRKIRIRTVTLALLTQVLFGVLVLYVPAGCAALEALTSGVQSVINSANAGIDFLFGPILPEEGSVFAFQVLPVIVYFAALTAVLHYVGILQWVVKIIGGAMSKLFGTTTAESMNAAANIFLGQSEAPLLIKQHLPRLKTSELFAVMVGGMATVAGSVMVGYSLLGAELRYLIAASFMAAPGALFIAKLIVPAGALEGPEWTDAGSGQPAAAPPRRREGLMGLFKRGGKRGAAAESAAELTRRQQSQTGPEPDAPEAAETSTVTTSTEAHATSAADTPREVRDAEDIAHQAEGDDEPANVIDAAARGASEGLGLALNVGAMLLAFIALIALVNTLLGAVGGLFGLEGLTMEQILGWIFAPVMFIVGVPWNEAVAAGSFLGQKLVLNEFVAFSAFGPEIGNYSPKTQVIVTFALTGFANFATLAIQIGALGGLAPTQRSRIARLGLLAVLSGTLANLMSAAIAGVLIA
ncbi:NupC/NupG family nucleoside CNT transporter [Kocuria soli]|uniref:NupC/NupG family nucleoside CNT transporter n=1 Tax=Kocuria soli TaxID=2485125 RepID=A0A3N3ZVU8_9MICC|nr:NupC/NupG family nucleoside CNT transporter [Kocuria soli]ROZ64348.1 NupC/NupG family nucleoside CNT transporter [Kocuria soli]